jgi:hypothetical protein
VKRNSIFCRNNVKELLERYADLKSQNICKMPIFCIKVILICIFHDDPNICMTSVCISNDSVKFCMILKCIYYDSPMSCNIPKVHLLWSSEVFHDSWSIQNIILWSFEQFLICIYYDTWSFRDSWNAYIMILWNYVLFLKYYYPLKSCMIPEVHYLILRSFV